jgi:hypothetical protein
MNSHGPARILQRHVPPYRELKEIGAGLTSLVNRPQLLGYDPMDYLTDWCNTAVACWPIGCYQSPRVTRGSEQTRNSPATRKQTVLLTHLRCTVRDVAWADQLDGETDSQYERRMRFRQTNPGLSKAGSGASKFIIVFSILGCLTIFVIAPAVAFAWHVGWRGTVVASAFLLGFMGLVIIWSTLKNSRSRRSRP